MKRHVEVPRSEKRPRGASRPGIRHILATLPLLAGAMSMIVFVALYRAPMPVDAFAALGGQIAGAASVSAAG